MASSLTHLSPNGDQAAHQASWVRHDGLRTCDKKTSRTHRTGGARRIYHNLDELELSKRLSTGVHLNSKTTASTSTRGRPTSTRPLHVVYRFRTLPRHSHNSETLRTTCLPKISTTTPDMCTGHDSAPDQACRPTSPATSPPSSPSSPTRFLTCDNAEYPTKFTVTSSLAPCRTPGRRKNASPTETAAYNCDPTVALAAPVKVP